MKAGTSLSQDCPGWEISSCKNPPSLLSQDKVLWVEVEGLNFPSVCQVGPGATVFPTVLEIKRGMEPFYARMPQIAGVQGACFVSWLSHSTK